MVIVRLYEVAITRRVASRRGSSVLFGPKQIPAVNYFKRSQRQPEFYDILSPAQAPGAEFLNAAYPVEERLTVNVQLFRGGGA
jgi:hypothetical protein